MARIMTAGIAALPQNDKIYAGELVYSKSVMDELKAGVII